jgi:catechol 2,3-dioxygenase-like lactoylglutathione lyase family enzyme
MGTTEAGRGVATPDVRVGQADLKLEVVILPVADVDRAKKFYGDLGWRLDADFPFDNGFRVVQFTPPGSPCSVQFGTRLTPAAPGSSQGNYLVVSDIEAARADLVSRGAAVSDVFHPTVPGAQFQPTARAARRGPRPITEPIVRSPRSATRMGMAGCCRRSRPGFQGASTRRPRRTYRWPIS